MVDPINDAATSEEESTDNQLHDGIGIGTGCVEYRYTQLGHALDWNVVGPCSTAVAVTDDGNDHDMVSLWLIW